MVFGGLFVKRIVICAALLSAVPGLMQANGVISTASCGGSVALTASTTCSNSATYGSVLETFSDNLQWNAANDVTSPTLSATNANDPAMANGVMYDTTWDAVSLPISVTGSELELADNYIEVKKFSNWVNPTGSHPQIYEGTFDSQPDTSGATTPGTPGDYLLGSGAITGNTPTSGLPANAITISSTVPLSNFGFRIASEDYTSFDVVIQLYGLGNTPIGSPLTVSNLGGGGLCPTLAVTAGQPNPVACNTAPFVMVTSGVGVYSFAVYTTQTTGSADNGGFFLDTFSFDEETAVPEPGSLLLAGAGLASTIALIRRRNRRQALGHIGAKSIDKA
jgi:hypothetical protein